MQVKSDNESRSEGIGQLLITAIVTCMKSQCKVLALLLHPKSVRINIIPDIHVAPSYLTTVTEGVTSCYLATWEARHALYKRKSTRNQSFFMHFCT